MRIFVCSRYRAATPAQMHENIRKTKGICRALALAGHDPFAPHLFFTQFLDDEVEAERALGIHLGQKAMLSCDEVMLAAADGISDGMEADLEFAEAHGKPVHTLGDWASSFTMARYYPSLAALREAGLVKIGGD